MSCPLSAQDKEDDSLPPKLKLDIEYASGLQELGFPDLADLVIGRLEREYGAKYPSISLEVEVIKVHGFILLGEFDKVKSLIDSKKGKGPEVVWALKLALADGYYAWGKYKEAQEIYNAFFAQNKEPSKKLKSFFVKAAYKYAQMLILMGEDVAAIKAYDTLLKAKPAKHIRRQAQSEQAELMVKMCEDGDAEVRKKYFPRIEKLCNEILWIQDVWFGKAIVYLAHVKKMQGDIKGAKELIDDYKTQLHDIDEALKEQKEETGEDMTRLSPMAECRYLVAVMMQDEGMRLFKKDKRAEAVDLLVGDKDPKTGKRGTGAYQHFLNVFIRYPATKWAGDAGTRARQIEDFLRDKFGATIESQVTKEQWAQVEKYQFLGARSLFNQNRFKDAVEAYETVLTLFPERPTSIKALGELARCYLILENDEIKKRRKPDPETGHLYSETVIRYIAERFKTREELMQTAGNVLLQLAVACGEEYKMPAMQDEIYSLFVSELPKHPRTANLLYQFGDEAFNKGDFKKAKENFSKIVAGFKNVPIYFPAFNRVAQCYAEMGDRTNEIATLDKYIAELSQEPVSGHALINAKYRRALAFRELGGNENLIRCAGACNELVELIKTGDPKYARNAEERENNQKALEGSLFFMALSQSMLTEPKEKLDAFKLKAIEDFKALVKRFPTSKFAPVAMSRIGILWTILDKPDEAEKALRDLQKTYPESEDAKNALFVLASSLMELGKHDEAIRVFKEMLTGEGAYSPGQILKAAKVLVDAKDYALALTAFDRVLSRVGKDDRALLEPALLGKGKALVELGKYEEAVKTLGDETKDGLLKRYPTSGLTVEACFYISRAYRELAGKEPNPITRGDFFNSSIKAMEKVVRYDKSPARRVQSAVGVGKLQLLKSKAEEQFNQTPQRDELVLKYKNDAIAAFETVIMLMDPSKEGVGPYMQEAYAECMPALFETATADNGRYANVVEDCEKYLSLYPEGKFVNQIETWKTRATSKMAQLGRSVPKAPSAEEEK